MLSQEYKLTAEMNTLEGRMKRFLNRTQSLTTVEFFFEQHEIKDEINAMTT